MEHREFRDYVKASLRRRTRSSAKIENKVNREVVDWIAKQVSFENNLNIKLRIVSSLLDLLHSKSYFVIL